MTIDEPAGVLVLGLGNLLLRDDGVGLELLQALRAERGHDERVEFVDGGTQGVALLGFLGGRRAVLILDAVSTGAAPGSVEVLRDPLAHLSPQGFGAHGANASGLLAAAQLLGELPASAAVVGVVPAVLETGVGLSGLVEQALPGALESAGKLLDELLDDAQAGRARRGGEPFTS
ncbi:MAG: hydrogenase maturation protease [Deltaproteobacteria bacterium]|nr:hydrogenase maturation protease [Deltaproteobacteria bacterium]